MPAPRLFAVLFALFVGCARIDYGPGEWSYDGPVNTCGGGCAEGTCDEELNLCATSVPYGSELIARVTLAPSTGVAPQSFRLNAAANVGTLRLYTPVQLDAAVRVGEEGASAPLVGRVIFSDVGNRLPGRPVRVAVFESHAGGEIDFSLIPGTYDIAIVPEGSQAESYPVRYIDDAVLRTDGTLGDAEGNPVDLIAPPAAATVVGRITMAGAAANGLRIVAIDTETGRTISTEDTTECEEVDGDSEIVCGHFQIRLAARAVDTTSSFSLRIRRPGESSHPVFRADGFTAPLSGGTLDLSGDSRLAFGALGVPVKARIVVTKPVGAASGAVEYDPAPSTAVALLSTDVGGGTVEKWVLANESGEVEDVPGILGVNLYPGTYAVTAFPMRSSSGAEEEYETFVSETPWTIGNDGASPDLEIRLESRPDLVGEVRAGAKPVPAAVVSCEPGPGSVESARGNADITGPTGRFRVGLDEAPYVVTAKSPDESRYAWALSSATVASSETSVFLDLPLPFVVRGGVESSAEQFQKVDLAGATVEWYREVEGRAYAVGRSQIDGEGRFVALLPP